MESVQIGPLTIHLYSIFILLGASIALYYGSYKMIQKDKSADEYQSWFLFTFIFAIIGARLWWVIANWNNPDTLGRSADKLGSALKIWEGGLAVQGGIILATIAGIFYVKWKKTTFNVIELIDVAAPSILLGQVFGRWGNFFNQEVFGAELDTRAEVLAIVQPLVIAWGALIVIGFLIKRPWKNLDMFNKMLTYDQVILGAAILFVLGFGFQYTAGNLVDYVTDGMNISGYRVPLFLIESVANIAGFIIIAMLLPKIKAIKGGVLFAAYFIWYGTVRIIMEPMRDAQDIMTINGISVSVVMSAAFIAFGLITLYYFQFSKRKLKPIERIVN